MLFDKLVLQNFGVFKGWHEIELSTQPPQKPIVLIGAENGAGKTTILDAFQLVLYGKFARCSKRASQAYYKFLKESTNKNVSIKDGACLELSFRQMEEGLEHNYRIHRKWYQNGKTLKEVIKVFKDGDFDKVVTENWNEYIEDLIPSNISHLFFFDGEKIEGYADKNNSSDLLGTAVHSLLGLDLVKQLQTDLVILERKQRIELKPRTEQEVIKTLDLELESIIQQRQVVAQNKASKVTTLERLQLELNNIESDLRNAGGDRLKDKQQIEEERNAITGRIQEMQGELLHLASGTAPFLLVKNSLKKILFQASSEQKTQEAKTIHNTLTIRDDALLNRLKQEKASESIIQTIISFLSEDRKDLLKQSESSSYLNLSSTASNKLELLLELELPHTQKEISSQTEKLLKLKGDLVTIDRSLETIPDEESLTGLIDKRDLLNASINKIELQIAELNGILDREKRDEEAKKRERNLLVTQMVKTDIENDDISRTIDYAAKTTSTLKLFQSALTKHHSQSISNKVLECFNQLIHKDTLIRELYIDPKTFTIEMLDGDGHLLSPNKLSAGERQLLATSILWALAETTGRPLPVIIDTPLGRLDSAHRGFLVERYFPKASHQVILLSTDEEIDKKLFEVLEPGVCRKYLLSYTDETSSSHIKQGYFF